MISKGMVKTGYKAGLIQLIGSPNEDGICCRIGDLWFYFGGLSAAEAESTDSYIKVETEENIIAEIHNTLEAFRKDGIFYIESEEEYNYYEMFLREHGIAEN